MVQMCGFYTQHIMHIYPCRTPFCGQLLQYATERKIDRQPIEDIYDGCAYRCIESALSVGSVHLSNTDGVDILHTSDFHLWPVLLMINELPLSGYFVKCIYIWLPAWCSLHLNA